MDECHELESDLEETFGMAVGPARASRLVASARRCGVCSPRSLEALGRAAERFTDVLATDAALRFGEDGRANPLVGSLVGLSAAAGLVADDATGAVAAGVAPKGAARVARVTGRLRDDAIRCAHPTGAGVVRYVSVSGAGDRVVRAVPTDLDRILSKRLWGRLPVVLCSADATSVLARRLGLGAQAFMRLGSPWDWRRQALLYVPELPAPREGKVWEDAACARIETMVGVAEGRSLVLATSARMLRRLAAVLRVGGGHRVLVQGEGTRGELLRQFVDDEASVLVATRGFFTGVDAPGATLSLLVAKRARGGAGFAGVDLAATAVALNQAVGRLLRSSRDAGVVMVTDPRLVDAGYGKKLLAELPDMRRTRSEAEATEFLRDVLARSI
jgi:Rad3-related DNA helicase